MTHQEDTKVIQIRDSVRGRLESRGGALHLILFDTSPLQVHTQQTLSLPRLLAQTLEIAVYRLLSKLGVCAGDRKVRLNTGVSDG